MKEYENELSMVFLKPGGVFIGKDPVAVRTVLGSCVAMTVFDKRLRAGAICHGVMPSCGDVDNCDDRCVERFRFVDCAITGLLALLKDHGAQRGNLTVKLFGGADMLDSPASNSIGLENIRAALVIVARESLKLVAQDVGDSFGRKLIFHPHTGNVFVKRLTKTQTMKENALNRGARA